MKRIGATEQIFSEDANRRNGATAGVTVCADVTSVGEEDLEQERVAAAAQAAQLVLPSL